MNLSPTLRRYLRGYVMMYTLYTMVVDGPEGRGTPISAPDEQPETLNYRRVKVLI